MIRYFCDGPGCLAHPDGVHARMARSRGVSREAPVVYLSPVGWEEVVRRDGTRFQACSTTCRAALISGIDRDPRDCPTCGTRLTCETAYDRRLREDQAAFLMRALDLPVPTGQNAGEAADPGAPDHGPDAVTRRPT